MPVLEIDVECGFKTLKSRNKIQVFLSDLSNGQSDRSDLVDKITSLSNDTLDWNEISIDDAINVEVTGPVLYDDGKMYFGLIGGVHSCDQFWEIIVNILIKSGANYLFSVTYHSGVGEIWVEVLKRKKLETVYVTGGLGEADELLFDCPDEYSRLEHAKKLYSENKLVAPTLVQDDLVYIIQNSDKRTYRNKISNAVCYSPNINEQDSKGQLPLVEAVKKGDLSIVKWMCEVGEPFLNPLAKDKFGATALDVAQKKDQKDILHQLNDQVSSYEWWKNKSRRKNPIPSWLLSSYCRNGNASEVSAVFDNHKYVLDDINQIGAGGELPITAAIKSGSIETVKLICSKLPDPKLKNSHGETAIELAKKLNNKLIINAISKLISSET